MELISLKKSGNYINGLEKIMIKVKYFWILKEIHLAIWKIQLIGNLLKHLD